MKWCQRIPADSAHPMPKSCVALEDAALRSATIRRGGGHPCIGRRAVANALGEQSNDPLQNSNDEALTPHPARAGADVQLWSLARGPCCGAGRHNRPRRPFEQTEQFFRNETCPGCIEVAVALRLLAVDEKALRHDQMKVVLCAGHGDVEQATFLLDFGRGAGTEVGGHAAVDGVEQIHRLPLLAQAV